MGGELFRNLRNNHRNLVRSNAFSTGGIDAFHYVVVGCAVHDRGIHVSGSRLRRRVHQRKAPATYHPIDVVACYRNGRGGGCSPTEVDRIRDRRARTTESYRGRASGGRVATDGKA